MINLSYVALHQGIVSSAGPTVGSTLPDFEVETTGRQKISRQMMSGRRSIFAFFSTSCSVCKPSLSYLMEYIDYHNLRPEQVVAVLEGEPDDVSQFHQMLQGRAAVVIESSDGPVRKAFQVSGTPTFVMVDADGLVTESISGARQLVSKS